MGYKRFILLVLASLFMVQGVVGVSAQSADSTFSLQVSPSPLVLTLKPGETRDVDLKIRNAGTQTEKLKIELKEFAVKEDESLELLDTEPVLLSSWIKVKEPVFNVDAGQWYTQNIHMQVPEDAGFSYSFTFVISRNIPEKKVDGGAAIQGSVAVFALLGIDREGAKRQFNVETVSSSRRVYEFLPANFSVKIKNTGNTIVQPIGNVFIQRKGASQPITVLPLNAAGSYILPDQTRTIKTEWNDGFPRYEQVKVADNAEAKQQLKWNWNDAEQFRFGRYQAVVVAVYNDGERDVPINATIEFWVIPWKLLALLTILGVVVLVGIIAIVRRLIRTTKHIQDHRHTRGNE